MRVKPLFTEKIGDLQFTKGVVADYPDKTIEFLETRCKKADGSKGYPLEIIQPIVKLKPKKEKTISVDIETKKGDFDDDSKPS